MHGIPLGSSSALFLPLFRVMLVSLCFALVVGVGRRFVQRTPFLGATSRDLLLQ